MGSQSNSPHLDPDVRRVFDSLRWIVRELRLSQNPDGQGAALSAAQRFVLHVLKERGALCLGDLAEHTATDPSSVSVVVRKLHAKGLVAKQASPEDRRRLEVTLTAAGAQATGAAPPPAQQVLLERMLALGPEELSRLAELLERVAPPVTAEQAAPMFFQEGPKGGRRP